MYLGFIVYEYAPDFLVATTGYIAPDIESRLKKYRCFDGLGDIMSEEIFNEVLVKGTNADKVVIYIGSFIASIFVISMNTTEQYEKVLMIVSSEKYYCDSTLLSKIGLCY